MAVLQVVRWGPASGAAPRQLIVLCHGVGASGRDLIELAPIWGAALPDALFVAPDAPEPYDAAPTGRQWFSLWDRTPALLQAGAAAATPLLDATIAAELARAQLRPDDYALVGFSQGAMMALYAGLRRIPPPRAIVAYSGGLLADAGAVFNRVPVLLAHGIADEVVPASRSRDAETVLRAAGVPVRTLFVPDLGHTIDEAGLAAGAALLRQVFGVVPR